MLAIDVLLTLPIIVLLFSAYEIGALVTKKWHTISYYAARNKGVKYAIIVLFFLAWIAFNIWFGWHLAHGIPQ